MSGECELCGNHTLECECNKENVKKSHIQSGSEIDPANMYVLDNSEDYKWKK